MAETYKTQALAWLRRVLDEEHLTAGELARRAHIAPSTLTRPLNDPDYPYALSLKTLTAIATATRREPPRFGVAREEAWGEFEHDRRRNGAKRPASDGPGLVLIPEFPLDSADPLPNEAISYWPFNRDALREMAVSKSDLAVYAVKGDAMAPTLVDGDRAIIDRTERKPGAGGLFALWEDGVVFRRLDRLPGPKDTKPRYRLSADAQRAHDHDVEADWLTIIGRVALIVRRFGA